MKTALCDATELNSPKYDRHFIIHCDASSLAIGASLSQLDDNGLLKPIAFVSAKLSGSQLNWCTVEQEAFSLLFALKRFEIYIFGSRIVAYMDNNPCQFLVKCVPTSARLTRWMLSLAKFDLSIIHLNGVENKLADMLSRC